MLETIKNVFNTLTVDINSCENKLINFFRILPQIIIFVNNISGAICSGVFVVVEHNNISDKCIAVIIFFITCTTNIKLYVFKSGKKDVNAFFDSISDITGDEVFFESCFLAKIYYYSIVGSLALWNLSPLLNATGKLPAPLWLPFDTSTPLAYYSVYIYQVSLTITACVAQCLMDLIFYLMASSITVRLTRLSRSLDSDSSAELKSDTIRQKLKDYITTHSRCIADTTTVEKLIGNIFLVQMAQSISSACMFSYALVNTSSIEELPRWIFCGMTMILILFIFCMLGQRVSNLFEEVHTKFFWWIVDRDLNIEQLKLIVVTQTVSAPTKTIKSFLFPLSYHSFGVVIKESVRYYMFLRTVFNNNISNY